jgi:hypothetical protein
MHALYSYSENVWQRTARMQASCADASFGIGEMPHAASMSSADRITGNSIRSRFVLDTGACVEWQ